MEGKLAEQGILDRDAVWAALNSNRPRSELEYPRLMSFVDVEAWANAALLGDMRSTTGRLRASAAARGASPISCIARP